MRHHPPPRSPAATPRLLVPTAVVPLSGSSAPSRILIPASSHLSSSIQVCVVLVLLHFRRIHPLLLLLRKTLPSTTTPKNGAAKATHFLNLDHEGFVLTQELPNNCDLRGFCLQTTDQEFLPHEKGSQNCELWTPKPRPTFFLRRSHAVSFCGDDPQEDLAKFGYKVNIWRKYILLYLWLPNLNPRISKSNLEFFFLKFRTNYGFSKSTWF